MVEVGPARPATAVQPSAGPVYRHVDAEERFPTIQPTTLYKLFDSSVRQHADLECLGMREVKCGVAVGVKPHQRVTVLGPNCPEWMVAIQVGQWIIMAGRAGARGAWGCGLG